MGDIVVTVEFRMSLLLFVALGGCLIASRINQSAVFAEILIGLIVGPSVPGLITYTDFVAGIAKSCGCHPALCDRARVRNQGDIPDHI
jgi:hypothetical protein